MVQPVFQGRSKASPSHGPGAAPRSVVVGQRHRPGSQLGEDGGARSLAQPIQRFARCGGGDVRVVHADRALDDHPRPKAANHVRQMLVAHGVLAPRDERLVTLERLNAETVAAIARPEDRKTVAAFAAWRVLRRVRRRADHDTTSRTAIRHARNQVLGAVRFLDWLPAHDRTLATCTQGDLDLWLATGPRSRYDVRHFLEWTSERKLSLKLNVPPVRSAPGRRIPRGALICDRRAGLDVGHAAGP